MDKSIEWAVRCTHEAQMHKHNCFITLTYNDESLPHAESLRKDHLQTFMKRVRHHHGPFSYFAAGEYGTKGGRPHYHACLFGVDFIKQDPNSYIWKQRKLKGETYLLWRSPLLESRWSRDGKPLGYCSVGALTFKSAAYCARYIMKKVVGAHATGYRRYNGDTGEFIGTAAPEFQVSSTTPAVGKRWLEQYWRDIYPSDFVVIDGKKYPVPDYYDRWLEQEHPRLFDQVAMKREELSESLAPERTPERLAARKKIFTQRMANLKRGHDDVA